MNKIRKGDQVVVITGRDKGKKGTVTQILEGSCSLKALTYTGKTLNQTQLLVQQVV